MTERPRVLCVDDEPLILQAVRRNLGAEFDLTTATGGRAAIEVLDAETPFDVIVCDLRMPEVDGIAVLRHARQAHPDTVRVLLTGGADLQTAIRVVNEGQVFRFLTKPCPTDVLRTTMLAAAEQHRLITAERVLLEQTLRGSIRALVDIVALAHPAVVARAQRVVRIVRRIADRLKPPDGWMLETSALLAHVGGITLPDATIERLHSGAPLDAEDHRRLASAPTAIADVVGRIPRMERVRDVLLHQNTRWDGTDSPVPGVRGDEIPIASRILKAAADWDQLMARGMRAREAIEVFTARSGWYDPRVVEVLRGIAEETAGVGTQEMLLGDVRAGMIIAADIHNPSGVLLVARGQEVTASLLDRIHNYWDEYARTVHVKVAA